MTDGGIKLRDVLKTNDDIQYWESLLPSYAKLQQESAQYNDYSTWRINIHSRDRELLMLFLFSDVDEQNAPTRI